MAKIENREQFQEWLLGKPVEWAQVLALRSALRVLPIALDPSQIRDQSIRADLAAAIIRTASISWAVRQCPDHDLATFAAYNAFRAFSAAYTIANNAHTSKDSGYAAIRAADAASDVVYIYSNSVQTIEDVNHTAADAADAAAIAAKTADAGSDLCAAFWESLADDCSRLRMSKPIAEFQHTRLLARPLWIEPTPPPIMGILERSNQTLEIEGRLWIEWIDRRFYGQAQGFDLPEESDLEIQSLLLYQDNEWWERGLGPVTADIEAWIDEHSPNAVLRIKSELKGQFSEARRIAAQLEVNRRERELDDQSPPLGHNNPPSEIDNLLEQGERLVESDNDDVEKYKHLRDKIQGWAESTLQWAAKKADRFVDAAVESTGKAVGPTIVIGGPAYILFGGKIAQIIESLNKLIGLIG